MEERRGLKFVTTMVNRHASKRRKEGAQAQHINLDGMLALMHDKIIRYFRGRDLNEILNLAADGLFALEAAVSELKEEPQGVEEREAEWDEPGEEASNDISSLLPPEFRMWQEDSNIARELREYLEATNSWEKLDPLFKDQIMDAEDKDVQIEEDEGDDDGQ